MFKQNASYRVYLNGGRCGKGFGRGELKLRRTSQYGDSFQMANTITKYTNRSSFTIKILHLEGQKVFGSTKWRANITPGLKGDSHMHDRVNFSRLRVNTTPSGFVGSNVDANKSNGIVRDEAFVLTFQGLKVQECVRGDGVWRIERCPPSSNIHYFTIQRDSMKHCDTIVITKKNICGIPIHYMMVCSLI